MKPEQQPLLTNGSETTFVAGQRILNEQVYAAVTGQRLHKQTVSHGKDWNTTIDELLETVFSTRPLRRGYIMRAPGEQK
jgi:hypothetical protein